MVFTSPYLYYDAELGPMVGFVYAGTTLVSLSTSFNGCPLLTDDSSHWRMPGSVLERLLAGRTPSSSASSWRGSRSGRGGHMSSQMQTSDLCTVQRTKRTKQLMHAWRRRYRWMRPDMRRYITMRSVECTVQFIYDCRCPNLPACEAMRGTLMMCRAHRISSSRSLTAIKYANVRKGRPVLSTDRAPVVFRLDRSVD